MSTDTERVDTTPGHVGADTPLDLHKLFTARLQAARARPYLATALFALHAVESGRVPTMAVDRHWRCYVSPGFVDRTPVEELAGVWVHEVSHLLRDHHGRSDRVARERGLTGPGERLRMDIAADCEINDDVFGDGLLHPPPSTPLASPSPHHHPMTMKTIIDKVHMPSRAPPFRGAVGLP